MPIKRAKVLDDEQFSNLMLWVQRNSKLPERDRLILLLNYKAGLRAQEIAGLEWKDVTSPTGEIGQWGDGGFKKFTIPANIAKRGHEREVPMHGDIEIALNELRKISKVEPKIIFGAPNVSLKEPKPSMSANAVAQMLRRLYIRAGLEGCSSHSGRRTFITKLSRAHNRYHCSIKDVQVLAGHKDIRTTEKYIEPSRNAAKLIRGI